MPEHAVLRQVADEANECAESQASSGSQSIA